LALAPELRQPDGFLAPIETAPFDRSGALLDAVEGIPGGATHRSGQPPTDRNKGTLRERLLPDLLPNGVARVRTRWDKERFEAAKSQIICHF